MGSKGLLSRWKAKSSEEEGVRIPPDGGWGWVVVAASFLCCFVLDGIGYSFGILLNPIMEHYGEGKGPISLVGSILAGTIMLVGPIASFFVNMFGARIVCIAGAFISSLAIFVSTFSPNVPFLAVSYGVIGGFGLGMMYVPAVTSVGYWFEKRRSLVTGISTCGSGAGTIVFAPLATALEASLGWQGCNRVLSGMCLMCALFGLTMRPVPLTKKDEENSIQEIKNANKAKQTEEVAFLDGETALTTKDDLKDEKVKTADVPLYKNPAFIMIMAGNLPAVMGLYIPYMFLPAMSEERGLTSTQASILISIIGAFNTAGRVISGAVTDHPKVDALLVTSFALFFGAMAPLLMDLCSTYVAYILVSILFGLSLSAWPAVTSSMLVDLLGLEKLTSAFGVLTCIRGLAAFLGPPVAGFVVDMSKELIPMNQTGIIGDSSLDFGVQNVTLSSSEPMYTDGNYSYAFWISTGLLGLSSLVHFAAYAVKRRQQAR